MQFIKKYSFLAYYGRSGPVMELRFKMNEFFSIMSLYLYDMWINKFRDKLEAILVAHLSPRDPSCLLQRAVEFAASLPGAVRQWREWTEM